MYPAGRPAGYNRIDAGLEHRLGFVLQAKSHKRASHRETRRYVRGIKLDGDTQMFGCFDRIAAFLQDLYSLPIPSQKSIGSFATICAKRGNVHSASLQKVNGGSLTLREVIRPEGGTRDKKLISERAILDWLTIENLVHE